jgi:hypothetical protein
MQHSGTGVLRNLLAIGAAVHEFPAPIAGNITRIDIFAKDANASGDTTFDVNIEGASIFPDPADRPKLLTGETAGAKTGLAVPVARGEWITVDCDILAAGGFAGKVGISVLIEDNASAPPSGAAGGDLSGAYPSPIVSALAGRLLAIPSSGNTFTDDFNDNILNAELWTVTSFADVVEQNSRIEVRNANFLTFNSAGVNMTDKFIQCEIQAAGSMIFRIVHTSDPEGENIQITNNGSDLNFQKRTGSSTTTITSIPYNAVSHKYIKIEHVSASGLWVCSTSPTGLDGSWTVRSTFTPSLSVASVLPRWYCTSSGFQYFDNITSNIVATDPIIGKNLFGLLWDNPNNQIAFLRTLGVVPLLSADPVGAPANLPAGHGFIGIRGNFCWMWDGANWHSQEF